MGGTCGVQTEVAASPRSKDDLEPDGPETQNVEMPWEAEVMPAASLKETQDSITKLELEAEVHQKVKEHVRNSRLEEYKENLARTRRNMKQDPDFGTHLPANRYGAHLELPVFEEGKHVPVLGLLNPKSGAMAGGDILQICRKTPYYQDRFFNIVDVAKAHTRGGLMDVFRIELLKAKDEAKAMGTRPRVISGGGDGTGSFAVSCIFGALKADSEREEDGLADTGNGFIWSDAELEESFPALAQMPLGSANDFGHILGWGQKYPGDARCPGSCARDRAGAALNGWISTILDPSARITNFDVWGIMPAKGETACDFKITELGGRRGSCPNATVGGKRQLQLKEAGKPVPFFICLYFSAGFGAYMTARFQINRRNTPIKNRMEYVRQAAHIILEATPPQLHLRLDGVQIDCDAAPYFPPRRHRGTRGRGYREVGFYNINWQANALHGADRADIKTRLLSRREPVRFNDGFLDMYRWRFASLLKNPGLIVQTDKKKDLLLTFQSDKGKGLFFQWDGEARFAFSPAAKPFSIYIRKVLNIPVVLGPFVSERLTGKLDDQRQVKFEFAGDTQDDKDAARRRCLQLVDGQLDSELLATNDEIKAAQFNAVD